MNLSPYVGLAECYIAAPDPSLPQMLVLNQDVTLNTIEIFLPKALASPFKNGLGPIGPENVDIAMDLVTSAASYIADTADLSGLFPNYVSFGVSYNTDPAPHETFVNFWLLVYQHSD